MGSGTVGSDHSVAIPAEVTTDDFSAGPVNYISVVDDNSPTNRYAASAKVFDLQHSISASPDAVASGDEVTVKLPGIIPTVTR